MIGQAVASSPGVEVALAFLNVVQTIALAYLAADRHNVRAQRTAQRAALVRGSKAPSGD